MKPYQGAISLCALAVVAALATPSQAAWNNVFQVCCNSCRGSSSASAYQSYYEAPAPTSACPPPCPQTTCCTTQYVQRSYYQPVTTYERRSYYEPVTTYRTSYYWEPVTSYRYSCYYDPCTCSYQQVATPTTSYRLRSQCCPVTSYLQRCQMVPVTKYQQSFYYEPVTTCTSSNGSPAPVTTAPQGAVGEQTAPQQPAPPSQQGGVGEQRDYGNPQSNGSNRYYPRETPPPPMAKENKFTQPQRITPQAPRSPATTPPSVRIDRIVALPSYNLEGQVIRADRVPDRRAEVLLVSATEDGVQKNIRADEQGQFKSTVAPGKWLVYTRDERGRPVFQAQVDINGRETRQMILTSR